jgi:hypothetical protein
MPTKPKKNMPLEERAKQFMPFAAVKGLGEALALKEKIVVPKPVLTDDMAEELDRTFARIEIGSMITVVYYRENEYIQITGKVAHISESSRLLQVVDTRIAFDEICKVTL